MDAALGDRARRSRAAHARVDPARAHGVDPQAGVLAGEDAGQRVHPRLGDGVGRSGPALSTDALGRDVGDELVE
jgi:hypothetical protein